MNLNSRYISVGWQSIMNRKPLLILISIIFFFQCGQKSNSDNINAGNLIIEGQGVGQFRVGKTEFAEIVRILGADYVEIKHEDLRLEANYKDQGLSFYYQDDDSSKIIYAVILTQPFSGETSKGIGLNSTMEDASNAYGPPEWLTCETCEAWTARYKGIEFEIERDKSFPKFPLDEEKYLKKKISKIFVYKTSQ